MVLGWHPGTPPNKKNPESRPSLKVADQWVGIERFIPPGVPAALVSNALGGIALSYCGRN